MVVWVSSLGRFAGNWCLKETEIKGISPRDLLTALRSYHLSCHICDSNYVLALTGVCDTLKWRPQVLPWGFLLSDCPFLLSECSTN